MKLIPFYTFEPKQKRKKKKRKTTSDKKGVPIKKKIKKKTFKAISHVIILNKTGETNIYHHPV